MSLFCCFLCALVAETGQSPGVIGSCELFRCWETNLGPPRCSVSSELLSQFSMSLSTLQQTTFPSAFQLLSVPLCMGSSVAVLMLTPDPAVLTCSQLCLMRMASLGPCVQSPVTVNSGRSSSSAVLNCGSRAAARSYPSHRGAVSLTVDPGLTWQPLPWLKSLPFIPRVSHLTTGCLASLHFLLCVFSEETRVTAECRPKAPVSPTT